MRGVTRAQRRRAKAKRANAPQAESSKGSQSASTSAQQQTAAKKKNKKIKPERLEQNTPVSVEVVRPARASFPEESDGLVRSTRVVVEWRKDGLRYLAWGRLGMKKVDGRRECSTETAYQQLPRKHHLIGTMLKIIDSQIPIFEILDLIIATGKVLRPRQGTTVPPARPKQPSSQQVQRHSRRSSDPNQGTRERRSAAEEAARHEVLVIRPSDGKPSNAAWRRQPSRQPANDAKKRKQILARQRSEPRRLSWLRRHGYEAPSSQGHDGCGASGWITWIEALIVMPLVSIPAHTGNARANGAFPIGSLRMRQKTELRHFGDYRTLRLVLEAWDRLFEGCGLTRIKIRPC
jgi:hypothetical protein